VTALVRIDRPHDHDLDGLHAAVTELEAILGSRRAEVTETQSALAAFKIHYRAEVGLLHEELDRLELALAEAELGELNKRTDIPDPPATAVDADRIDAPPRLTTDAVRKLFRDVAKAIHPDLSQDENARDRRHTLMIEANRAYALGDEEQLRLILQAWERSPEAVTGTDREAMRLRLERRIAQINEQLALLAGDLTELRASPSWELKAMVDKASAEGKDLVKDMVRRLKRDILIATNRLDALRPPLR
jgi:hypothetical protein